MALAAFTLPPFDAIVHVPVPWYRKIHRGFDQSEILAQEIHRHLCVPHLKILKRHWGKEQAGLEKKDRNKQMLGRFSCAQKVFVPPKVLLVDDVVTTGKTLEGCAAELYQVGVQEIIGFSLATALL
jgi:ComF family protein